MFYNEEIVEELRQLYHDIEPEGEWDLSLSSLRQVIKTIKVLCRFVLFLFLFFISAALPFTSCPSTTLRSSCASPFLSSASSSSSSSSSVSSSSFSSSSSSSASSSSVFLFVLFSFSPSCFSSSSSSSFLLHLLLPLPLFVFLVLFSSFFALPCSSSYYYWPSLLIV